MAATGGNAAPKGHSVYVVYGAKALNMTDWGVGDVVPIFSKRWPSVALDLGL